MKGILAGSLAVIAALIGGTILFVYREADASYHAAHDRCLDAGGAWRPSSQHSFSGSCRVQGAAGRPPQDGSSRD